METLRAGAATATIDHEHGGRLSSLVVDGHELLLGPADGFPGPTGWGCFPMAPWAGRIRHGAFRFRGQDVHLPLGLPPHAIHGTTHVQAWEATGPGRLRCDLGPDWPWPGTAFQEIELTPRSITLAMRVETTGAAMPVSLGWHPWFRRHLAGVAVELVVPAERMWQRDAEGIPDGSLVMAPPGPWDDCFTALIGPVELRWPGVLDLYVESDCDHVVVYDEQPNAVCVEPQSAPPDAHRSGEDLATVTPGAPLEHRTTWIWERTG